ncbi:peroxisome assembly protein (Peroxin-2) [Coemansia umbellata]|uniref:RING-type E3 ubiquitin transferase (cysteine targeting) n=1 Tax=Coemansia umbellata TaxID=1424467 RepID=A0ABQ8PMP8_9FUNG|nr:peroxisome assembly protein (Peroxin-2) [Coemansia umbellata]
MSETPRVTLPPQQAPQQPWKHAWSQTISRIQDNLGQSRLTGNAVVPRNARVNKLDSELLDAELTGMIREPIAKAMSLLDSRFVDRHHLEIDAAIKAVLFWLSVASPQRRATYGQSLQNLAYASTGRGFARRIRLLGILSIGGGYLWARLLNTMSTGGWANQPLHSARSILWRLAQRIERIVKVAALFNFVAFIATGQYRSLVERALGLRLVSARPQLSHSVSFEFLNRQLVWHAFTEFVMFALPLVNPAKARAWAVRKIRAVLRLPAATGIDPAIAALPDHICAICFASSSATRSSADADSGAVTDDPEAQNCSAINPYATGCGHRYCYVCIKTRVMAEGDECTCLRCGKQVDHIYQFTETATVTSQGLC